MLVPAFLVDPEGRKQLKTAWVAFARCWVALGGGAPHMSDRCLGSVKGVRANM